MTILSFDLQKWPWLSTYLNTHQIALLLLKENNCAKLFWNPYINVEVMVRTSSIFDHFIIWPSSVTLIFNLFWEMFQMTLLLFKENNCAKLFWFSYINVEVMARTSSIYDHFIIWPSKVTLTFNLPKQTHQIALLLLKENNCAKLFKNPCINVEVMARTYADRRTMHIHWTEIVTTMSCSPQASSPKKKEAISICLKL